MRLEMKNFSLENSLLHKELMECMKCENFHPDDITKITANSRKTSPNFLFLLPTQIYRFGPPTRHDYGKTFSHATNLNTYDYLF